MTKSNSDEDRYCERMDFPNTFNEFAEQYGFTDKEEHYTNGSQLIPVFRVKQWLDHLPSIQPKTDVLDKIRAEIQGLRNCSCSCSDGIIDDVEDILDKYKAESEDKE